MPKVEFRSSQFFVLPFSKCVSQQLFQQQPLMHSSPPFQLPVGLLLPHTVGVCHHQRVQEQLRECLVHPGEYMAPPAVQTRTPTYSPRTNFTPPPSTGNCDHRGVRGGVHREDMVGWLLLQIQRMGREAKVCQEALLCYR